jgi:hypothetical protein
MNTLLEIQQWYHAQCNGDWEHTYGVKIDTLDNPGWSVTIELFDTELKGREFPEMASMEHETDWIRCSVEGGKFVGYGGPFMLEQILRVFLTWAAGNTTV